MRSEFNYIVETEPGG